MLSVKGITKVFGGFKAVDRVSFDVTEGEILGLIGPNGSGKSTTFNLIAGALAPSGGSIEFLGREIAGTPASQVMIGSETATSTRASRTGTQASGPTVLASAKNPTMAAAAAMEPATRIVRSPAARPAPRRSRRTGASVAAVPPA